MQAHLRLHSWLVFREEVCGAHPELERPEHMLNRTSPPSHLAGASIQAALHGFQHNLILPSSNSALIFGGRAPRLDGALHAVMETLGSKGARYFFGDAVLEVPRRKTVAVDATGAGDAFWGEFLSNLLDQGVIEKDLLTKDRILQAMEYGNVAG